MERAIIALFIILWMIGVCVLVNSSYQDLKYRILFSSIAIGVLALVLLLGLICLSYKVPLRRFYLLNNKSKIGYSVLYLVLAVGFICCIEYMYYQKNKESFSIEQEYLHKTIQDRKQDVQAELEQIQYFEKRYSRFEALISVVEDYDCLKIGSRVCIFIGVDTLIIHLNKTSMTPPMNHHIKDKIDYHGVRSVGLSVPGEPYNLSHPSSRRTLEYMRQNGSVRGSDLVDLVKEKELFYNQRSDRYGKILLDNQSISFFKFLVYNLFNYTSIANNNILVKILVLIQTMLIAFVSGYIYKTLYKMLDGDNGVGHVD